MVWAPITDKKESRLMKQFIMMKRVLACLLISALMTALAALAAASAFADLSLISQGEACLKAEPPEYEEAAQLFRRAGLQGDGEGYYRLARMYEEGLLVVGNPCTDDIAALGKQKAEEYYKLASDSGYVVRETPRLPGGSPFPRIKRKK